MAEDDDPYPFVKRRVTAILRLWLIPAAEAAAEPRRISEAARQFWTARYTSLFYETITQHKRVFEEDGHNMVGRARAIGKRAGELAQIASSAVVEERHAEQASAELDCKLPDEFQDLVWCVRSS